MTIAMCYLSPEGIILGADSTSSLITQPGVFHFFNHNQKLFELGSDSTVGVLTWGLGSVGNTSHRHLISLFADQLATSPAASMKDIASQWTIFFTNWYQNDITLKPLLDQCNDLMAKARTPDEEEKLIRLRDVLNVGFCFAGHVLPDRTPQAFHMTFGPNSLSPVPTEIPMLSYAFWGIPNMIKRLIWGFDENLEASILSSTKWSGSPAELRTLLEARRLSHAILPIRDAVDFVHTCIYSTIKAMKFSNQPQVCGGPIEIAVITADRKFRWVRHKTWDAAILESENS